MIFSNCGVYLCSSVNEAASKAQCVGSNSINRELGVVYQTQKHTNVLRR